MHPSVVVEGDGALRAFARTRRRRAVERRP